MQNHFKKVLKNSGITSANYHSLRHTFATRCIELGFDVKSLSEILGHASVNITMNRYVHPSMDLKKENMQRLSKLKKTEKNAIRGVMYSTNFFIIYPEKSFVFFSGSFFVSII